jgi:hypothetical protein
MCPITLTSCKEEPDTEDPTNKLECGCKIKQFLDLYKNLYKLIIIKHILNENELKIF